MLPSKPRSHASRGWQLFVQDYLGASEQLSQRLWQLYEPRCPLGVRYVLERAGEDGSGVALERVWLMMRPKALFSLTLALSPERPGRQRDAEVIALEESILQHFRPGVS